MVLLDAVTARFHDDKKSLAWHIESPTEMLALLRRSGLTLADSDASYGPKLTRSAVRAAQLGGTHGMPAILVDAWLKTGPARWEVDDVEYRVLGPSEVVKHRAKLRPALRKKYPDAEVVATIDGAAALLVTGGKLVFASGEPFTLARFAAAMLEPLHDAICEHVVEGYVVEAGKKLGATARSTYLRKGKRRFTAAMNGPRVAVRGASGKTKITTHDTQSAANAAFDTAVAKAKKLGFA